MCSRTDKPILSHTCYFDFRNIMGSKSGRAGQKKKEIKRKRKLQQTKLMGCSVVERSGDIRKQALPYSSGLIPGAWIYVPVMTFPALQRMLTQ